MTEQFVSVKQDLITMFLQLAELPTLAAVIILSGCSSSGTSPGETNTAAMGDRSATYQLSTEFQGVDHPLMVSTATVMLAEAGDQGISTRWALSDQGDGFFRITNASVDDAGSLAVSGEAADNSVQITQNADDSSQLWQVLPLDNGYCRLTSQLLGAALSLDIVNDVTPRQVSIAASGNFSGQHWKLEADSTRSQDSTLARCTGAPADYAPLATSSAFTPTAEYREIDVQNFRVLVNPVLDVSSVLFEVTMDELDSRLSDIEQALPPSAFKSLQQVQLWVELNQLPNGGAQYHVSENWLRDNGYNPEKAGGVEISNASNFVIWSQSDQPSMILHEMAHAWDFNFRDDGVDFSGPYQQTVASVIYESVDHVNGTVQRAYALTDEKEYFAEVT